MPSLLMPNCSAFEPSARDDGALVWVMPFREEVVGRPGFLHGGAIAGLLEFAALGTLYEALGGREATARPINVSVDFMRGGTDHDTFAAAVGDPARQPGRQRRGPCLAAGPRQTDRGGADEFVVRREKLQPSTLRLVSGSSGGVRAVKERCDACSLTESQPVRLGRRLSPPRFIVSRAMTICWIWLVPS